MKGGYALVLDLEGRLSVAVGGRAFRLEAGKYAYAGSALGPGGVEARTGRHLRRFARDTSGTAAPVMHWHVDYLRPAMSLISVVAAGSDARVECMLTRALKAAGAQVVEGFGATDCREGCGGHLLRLGGMSGRGATGSVCGAFRRIGLQPVVIYPPCATG